MYVIKYQMIEKNSPSDIVKCFFKNINFIYYFSACIGVFVKLLKQTETEQ